VRTGTDFERLRSINQSLISHAARQCFLVVGIRDCSLCRRGQAQRRHGYPLTILLATAIAAGNPFFSFTAFTRAFCFGLSCRM